MFKTIAGACRPMAGLLLAATCLASAPAWAQADTAEARRGVADALVKIVSELSGPERTVKLMKASMQDGVLAQVRATPGLTPAQQQRAADVLSGEMASTMTDMLTAVMPGMYAAMTDIYTQRFSLAELQELQRFYASDAGRKSMTVMMEDMPRMMQPLMQTFQSQAPRIKERMEAAIARLKAEGIELPQRRP